MTETKMAYTLSYDLGWRYYTRYRAMLAEVERKLDRRI
jgi:hypothetical protein